MSDNRHKNEKKNINESWENSEINKNLNIQNDYYHIKDFGPKKAKYLRIIYFNNHL